MTREDVQRYWQQSWLLFMIKHGQARWYSVEFLEIYDLWITEVYLDCQRRGAGPRTWLRALRSLPNKDVWENEFVSFLYIPKFG